MAREDIITGIDIGSTAVRVVCGQIKPVRDHQEVIQIIGAAEAETEGVSKGVITSIEDAVASMSAAVEKCERMTGVPIEDALVSVNGVHVTAQQAHGVVAIAKANGEVGEDDVARAIEAAQSIATPPNYEILHVIPRSFTVDHQTNVKDPIGMTGIKLEVDAQIILGMTAQVKNITKAVYRTGVDIRDLVFAPLASAESTLTKRQKELGAAVVAIGGSTTSLAVYEEGDLLYTSVLPVGSGHITNDIAIGLRTSVDVAEAVKRQFGTMMPELVGKHEEIDLATIDASEKVLVSRKEVAEIIQARVDELFAMIGKELKAIDRFAKLPAGMVFTGGGAKMEGLVDHAKEYFKTSAAVGVPQHIQTPIEKIQDPSFTTAIGLVLWGANAESSMNARSSNSSFSSVAGVTGKIGKWVKSFMP